jgi:Rieske 2Fe-2S family protein
VVVHRARWRVGANWKLVVENFQESHHFGTVHPLLEARTPSARAESLLGDGDWLGGRMPIAPAFETVSHAGRIDERPFLVPAEARGAVVDALLFPLTMLSLQPDYLLTYRLEPTAVDETFVEHELLVDRDARGPFGDVVRLWAEVHDQDRRACESQTRAIAGGAWRPRFYATCEDGVHAFDARIAAFYRAELASDASARAAGASTQVGTDSAAASVGPFDRRV